MHPVLVGTKLDRPATKSYLFSFMNVSSRKKSNVWETIDSKNCCSDVLVLRTMIHKSGDISNFQPIDSITVLQIKKIGELRLITFSPFLNFGLAYQLSNILLCVSLSKSGSMQRTNDYSYLSNVLSTFQCSLAKESPACVGNRGHVIKQTCVLTAHAYVVIAT